MSNGDIINPELKAVLLVGGMGTRLRSVISSTPKPLATVGHSPFLDLLVRQLQMQGITRIVMCSGYLADQVESFFGDGHSRGLQIEYSVEKSPLGTAGAVKLASKYLKDSREFVVMNGDSFMQVDFRRLIDFHRRNGAAVTLAVRKLENSDRYGTVTVEKDGRVSAFVEKSGRTVPGVVNAGVYIFNSSVIDRIPDGPSSLETELFPNLLADGVFALEQKGIFIDIGTPEDYQHAQELFQQLYAATASGSDDGVSGI